MEKILKAYYTSEINLVTAALVEEFNSIERDNIVWYAIQRCLGAGSFAQMNGLSYEKVEALFEWVKQELEEMR